MLAQLIPTILILLSALYAGVGLFIYGRRPGPAITLFAYIMFSISIWSLGYGLELLAPSLAGKLFWSQVEIIGIASIAVFLFSFSAAYTGRGNLLSVWNRVLIWIIPSITILLAWLPPYRFLIWETITMGGYGPLTYLSSDYGSWAWIQVAYSYLLIGLAAVFLLLEAAHSPQPFRRQAGITLLGVLLPAAGNVLSLSGTVLPGIDLTPFAFLPAMLVMAWGIMRHGLLDILPMAASLILRELQDGVLVLDSRRRILYLNRLAGQLLQTSAEVAIGQPIGSIQPSCLETIDQLIDGQQPFLERELNLNGQSRYFDIRLSDLVKRKWEISSPDASYLITLRDIHDRKQVELNLQRREAMMAALNRAAQQFLRSAAWEKNVPAFLETLGQAAKVGRAFVFQNYEGPDGQLFTSQCYEWATPGIPSQIDNPAFRQVLVQEVMPAAWCAALKQERLVTALTRDLSEASQAPFLERGVLSTVIVPIFVERRWWGFLGLEDYVDERQWSKAKLDALQAAAEILSASEVRARNENALHRRQRTLNLLHEIVTSALQTTDRRSMAQTIVNYLGDLINADGCFLSVWEQDRGKLIPLAAYGLHSRAYLAMSPEPGEPTLTTSALAVGHTLIVDDLSNTPYLSQRIAALIPFHSALALPLIAGQKNLGAILLAYSNAHQFSAEEISTGEQAAGLIALTLEKFYAIEEARKRAEEAEILRKAGAAVAATLRSEEAINRILEQLSLVLPYDSASVQLLRKNELEIVGGRGWNDPDEVLGMRFPVGDDNPNSIVIQTGKPYILGDAGKAHASFNREGPYSHIRSWLGVPLIVRGQVIGLLTVDSKQFNSFTEAHLKTVSTFSDQVAMALENARLFEEVQNLALTDGLTGLYNRRGLFEIGHIEFNRTRRLERPFSAIMIALDHFKSINDQYGHPVGDQVLQFLASELTTMVRGSDIVGRYGGEEFAIFLSGSDGKAAMEMAERLRVTIERTPFYVDEAEVRVTISLGVAEYNQNNPNLETLVARADQALYVAKHKGRNRVARGV